MIKSFNSTSSGRRTRPPRILCHQKTINNIEEQQKSVDSTGNSTTEIVHEIKEVLVEF